jgi:glutamine synthetase
VIILSDLSHHTVFGIELEFYTEGIKKEYLFLNNIKNKIASLGFSCEKEISINQYEIKSGFYTNSDNLIKYFELAKQLLTEVAQKLCGNACFKAKPYLD